MMKKFMTISVLIDKINEIDEGFLYSKSSGINADEEVLIVNEDAYTIPDETIGGFQYKLGLHQVQDIIENLRMQIEKPTTENYIDAIDYYIKNDAFITKEEKV